MSVDAHSKYEITIRFDEFTGVFKGMHYAEIHGRMNDDRTAWVSAPAIEAVPVALGPGDPGKPLSEITSVLDLTAAATALKKNEEIAALTADRDDARSALAETSAALAGMTTAFARRGGEIAGLTSRGDELAAEVEMHKAVIAGLRSDLESAGAAAVTLHGQLDAARADIAAKDARIAELLAANERGVAVLADAQVNGT